MVQKLVKSISLSGKNIGRIDYEIETNPTERLKRRFNRNKLIDAAVSAKSTADMINNDPNSPIEDFAMTIRIINEELNENYEEYDIAPDSQTLYGENELDRMINSIQDLKKAEEAKECLDSYRVYKKLMKDF